MDCGLGVEVGVVTLRISAALHRVPAVSTMSSTMMASHLINGEGGWVGGRE